jgi:hypothetical protein
VQTNQEGRYVLTDLAAKGLIVRVFAAKMYPQQWLVDVSELTNETVEHDFMLISAPILEGRILEDSIDKVYFNFTGQYTSVSGYASVQPSGTFTIVLAGSKEYEQNGERFTEQVHQYSICDLNAIEEIQHLPEHISYSLRIRPAGYEWIFYPQINFQRGRTTSLEVSPGQPTGSISGQTVDEAGLPVRGVGIDVSRPYHVEELTTKSDEQGIFKFMDVPEDTYVIQPWEQPETIDSESQYTFEPVRVLLSKEVAYKPPKIIVKSKQSTALWVSRHVLSAEEGVKAELIAGKAQGIVISLQPTATLSVEITSGFQKIQYLEVGLMGPDGTGTESESSGHGVTCMHKTFRNLIPGIYQLFVNAGGFKPELRTIEVKPGVHEINLTVELEATARPSLSGRVEWPDGKPARHVTVWLYQYYWGTEKFLTQTDGMFTFDNLFPGNYQIILKVPRFPLQTQQIEIHEDDVQDFVFRLQRGTQIRGKLVFDDGVPYPERPLLILGFDSLAHGGGDYERIQGVWKPDEFKGPPSYFTFYHLVAQFIEENPFPGTKEKFMFVFDRVLPGTYWICLWDDGPPDYTGKAVPLITPMEIVVEDVEDQFIEIPIKKRD